MAPSRGIITAYNKLTKPSPWPPVRSFTTTALHLSGHNRWSKIKHDKAKADTAKTNARSQFSKELTQASKLFGPDPTMNPRLADLITKAKREGFAKTSIDSAIARGQGRSTAGATLENVVIEGLLPGNVACIVDCETDQRLRTLQEVRLVLKNAGGGASATGYLFRKVGRMILEYKDGLGIDEALEAALEAGATDVWEVQVDGSARVAMSAEAGETTMVGEQVSRALGVQILTSEIIWEPNSDTLIELESDDAALQLIAMVDELVDKETSVQAVSMNVAQGQTNIDTWRELQSRLSA